MTEESPNRRYRRFHLELPLRVWFGKRATGGAGATEGGCPEGVPEEETTTTTISSGSCFFYVGRKPALGEAAAMRVEIPIRASGRAGSVLCQGSVVWVSDRDVQGKVGVACTIDWFRLEPPGKN